MNLASRILEYLENNQVEVLITSDDNEAKIASYCASFCGYELFRLPDLRANYADDIRSYQDEFFDLNVALSNYYKSQKHKKLLISPIRTLLYKLPKKELYETISLEFGMSIDIPSFKKKLYDYGYDFVEIVEQRGEVSFRGDVIDIYPINSNPLRILLFDDEIESIRYFICESQKSSPEELEKVAILPAYFSIDEKSYKKIEDRVHSIQSDSFIKDFKSLGYWVLEDLSEHIYKNKKTIFIKDMQEDIGDIKEFYDNVDDSIFNFSYIDEPNIYKDIKVVDLDSLLEFHKDKSITIIAKNEQIVKRRVSSDILYNYIQSDIILNVISSNKLIVSLNSEEKSRKRAKNKIILDELKIGDYVVHESYGIGIFSSIEQREVMGAKSDFVIISYQGDDKLLIPTSNLEVIDRYIASSGSVATIDKLGKGSFAKLKAKTKDKLFEIAASIVATAASREILNANVLSCDNALLKIFQNDAGFTYTEDQIKCIEDIKRDIKSKKSMDRLLSGDVGFGKTEVAMNAIFIAIKSGFQAIFIAPTTLLSSQHFKSLKTRFDKYGIKVARYDRFTSTNAKKQIKKGVLDGSIDVVVGTHSLFDLKFKNLSLAIIDEEHKFGVKQKEKLKDLRENIHILSMSATPIPRSLNQALSSIKDYSVLLTPPSFKEDVRTFVKEYDEKVVKEVIQRELRRSGQLFYVHNNIASLERKKSELLKILPQLRILILHSKVSSSFMENEMKKFEEKEYDLLLSTSIVESGIHIPNVNTILIDSSDNFGMADLHQLRGRVGRGKKSGYCYYFVESKLSLTPEATKRLVALESNSFLGSGSVLAYHDLEIRGGGNLVGDAQSGHIKNIGYSLYIKMLEDAINQLLGKSIDEKKECEVKLSVDAYISDELVSEDRLRLELYRRLSRCTDVKTVNEIEEEIVDRFGKIDVATKQFLDIITIKILSLKLGYKLVSNYQQNITFTNQSGKKELILSKSRDDDDILEAVLKYLRSKLS